MEENRSVIPLFGRTTSAGSNPTTLLLGSIVNFRVQGSSKAGVRSSGGGPGGPLLAASLATSSLRVLGVLVIPSKTRGYCQSWV